jgi:predicted RNA-binding protein with TRAM domain
MESLFERFIRNFREEISHRNILQWGEFLASMNSTAFEVEHTGAHELIKKEVIKPVEVGKEYEVEVTDKGRKGDGIARYQGFVIFVKNGKVGQKVKVRVGEVRDMFATRTYVDRRSPL